LLNNKRESRRIVRILFLMLQSIAFIAVAETLLLDEKVLSYIEQKYGMPARSRLESWDSLMRINRNIPESEKLSRVNDFFNQLRFISDDNHWQKKDYWATPIEFLSTNGGDCEDFALAKYFTLRELGVSDKKLRLTYVKAIRLNQAHMVLSYFETPSSEPFLLDNLDTEIRLASKRRDLVPVYSFNGKGLWLAKEREQGRLVGKSSRIGRWTDIIERMQGINKQVK